MRRDTPPVSIDVYEVTTERDDLVDALVAARNATLPEINPDDPPVGADEMRSELAKRSTLKRVRAWVALLDGRPAGDLTFELEDDEANRHVASSDWFAVVPGLRRRGVGDALLRTALASLAEEGRTSLLLWGQKAQPDVATPYAARLGLVERTEERCSRVRTDEIPDDVIESWLQAGRSRDDGYRVVQFSDRCPDDLLDAYVQAVAAMQDIPVDDLEWTPPEADAALLRSREENWAVGRLTPARTLVLAPDGSGAGLSELFVSGFRPPLAYQGDTGVVAAHRGRGLGRWLKAENLRFAQQLAPGFEVIETYNAQSNPWMLDINVAMGFRAHVMWRGFQGDLAAALAVVA